MGELSDSIVENLLGPVARTRGIFKKEAIQHIVKNGRDAKDQYSVRQLFGLLVLELWWRIFLDPEEWATRPPNFQSILA